VLIVLIVLIVLAGAAVAQSDRIGHALDALVGDLSGRGCRT
jgi:hypothetical protein